MESDIARSLRIEKWRQIILEANNSDMPKIQYIHEHNLSENSFYYWQRLFRREAVENGTAPAAVPQSVHGVPQPADSLPAGSSFIEVTPPSVQAPSAPSCKERCADPDPEWTMMLRHGDYSLYLDNKVSEKCLKTVLRAISHA